MDSGTPGSLPVVWLAAAEIGLFGVVHNCRNFFSPSRTAANYKKRKTYNTVVGLEASGFDRDGV